MLPDINVFYRQPIPVNLEHTDLKAHLESAVSSTYLHLNAGTCTSVKIGTSGMAAAKLLQNLQTALPEIIKRLAPTKRRRTEEDSEGEQDLWGNIQSLMIKTSESASLPIWSCQLGSGEGGRWDGLVAEQLEMEVDEEEHDGLSRISAKRKAVKPPLAEPSDASKGKRKKRAAEESKDEPKKKRKKNLVGTDEVTSEMKGLAIQKATPAKSEKTKTGGKMAETNGSASSLIKIKIPSSTKAPSKPAPPTPESARKPKKKTSEEKPPGKRKSLPLQQALPTHQWRQN
jgi:ribosome biogenesis protein UTP30